MAIIWMKQAPPILGMLLNRQRKFVQIKKTSIQQINHYRIIRIFLCMKWYVLLLSIHFKCTYIPIRYIFRVEPQIFDLRIYFWLVGPIKAFRQMTEIFLFVQDLASFSSFLRFKCASGTIKKICMYLKSVHFKNPVARSSILSKL